MVDDQVFVKKQKKLSLFDFVVFIKSYVEHLNAAYASIYCMQPVSRSTLTLLFVVSYSNFSTCKAASCEVKHESVTLKQHVGKHISSSQPLSENYKDISVFNRNDYYVSFN